MALETATYINQLNAANPLGSDPIASGDDHIRLIKSAIKATFPNITGPVTATQDQINQAMPSGGIIMWSGAANAIPAGWYLCNGANGTPDLRGKFVMGAGGSYAVGNTGGAESVTLSTSQLPSHTHTATSTFTGNALGSHSHSVSDPGHSHSIYGAFGQGDGGGQVYHALYSNQDGSVYPANQGPYGTTSATTGISVGSASAGTPSGTVATTVASTGSGAAVDIRNPYYALCYIMKA